LRNDIPDISKVVSCEIVITAELNQPAAAGPAQSSSADPLNVATLRQLRRIVRQARQHDARAVPMNKLVSFASGMPRGAVVTIDFGAVGELGQPLVVLRLVEPTVLGPAESVYHEPRLIGLPRREREVATLVAAGLTNGDIAARLTITLGTFKDHVHNILRKSGIRNRAAIAAAWGGGSPPPGPP
jgi:DNA-binding CsgD family transcriptional regulator